MDTIIQGINVDIEVTPRRISIIRDNKVIDIEMRSIAAVEMSYPKRSVPGRFRILYIGGTPPAGTLSTLDNASYMEFSKDQEDDFRRLRSLIHQYQDELAASFPQS